mmetsp:Transcript_44305/g.104978  ORF Transcript_44305/g.104978 Transcript_44305/m.104978 type:complete len:201 (-) Transcript_44305:1157-1759(-)
MGQKVWKAPSQNTPGSLNLRPSSMLSTSAISWVDSAKSKSARFCCRRSRLELLGMMTVPRCTPHRSRICAGVLACVLAIALMDACSSRESEAWAIPISTYEAEARLENAMVCTPFSRAKRSSLCCALYGCISTCSSAGFTRAYRSTWESMQVPMLQQPMLRARPLSTCSSIARHVWSYVTLPSNSILGYLSLGSKSHSGG